MSENSRGEDAVNGPEGSEVRREGGKGELVPAVTSAAGCFQVILQRAPTSIAESRIGASPVVAGLRVGAVFRELELARHPPTRAIREADRGETGSNSP